MLRRMGIGFALLCATGGCSTAVNGTAPAKDGYVYAAGSKVQPFMGWQPQVWLCPVPKKGECQPVTVTTEEQ